MENKLYCANYSRGCWDDYSEYTVFVSYNKDLVETWVEKFNKILHKWRNYYSKYELDNVFKGSPEANFNVKFFDCQHIYDRWHYIKSFNKAFISEVELR